jgi:hypothetical protein
MSFERSVRPLFARARFAAKSRRPRAFRRIVNPAQGNRWVANVVCHDTWLDCKRPPAFDPHGAQDAPRVECCNHKEDVLNAQKTRGRAGGHRKSVGHLRKSLDDPAGEAGGFLGRDCCTIRECSTFPYF